MSWSGTFQSFVENYIELNKKYPNEYVRLETRMFFQNHRFHFTGELHKVGEFQQLIELMLKVKKEVVDIEIGNDRIIIKSERGKQSFYRGMKNDTIYMGEYFHEEKVFGIIFDFIKNFKSTVNLKFQKDYILFEILPFQRIEKFYFKLNSLNELSEIKSIADKNHIRLINSQTEKILVDKNPHLKEVLKWENIITDDILYASHFPNIRINPFLAKRDPECGIIKEKSKDAWNGIRNQIKGEKLIDYIVFDSLYVWKKNVVANKNYWNLFDIDEQKKNQKRSSLKTYEGPEKSSINALLDGLPDDFNGNLEDAKRYLGLD